MAQKIDTTICVETYPIGSRERKKEIFKKWYAKNKEKVLDKLKTSYRTEPEKYKEKAKRFAKTFKGRTLKRQIRKRHRAQNQKTNKLWALANKDKIAASAKKSRTRAAYRFEIKARTAVAQALKDKIMVGQPCQICGSRKSQGHHFDYSDQHLLDVIWLCHVHHRAWHRVFVPNFPEQINRPAMINAKIG